MKKLLVLCLTVGTQYAWFAYDKAIAAAQQEQWQDANEQLKKLVAEHPERADLLYDAGIAAYKNEDFNQAKALFDAAATNKDAPRMLKEQAYFNKANAHVKLKELKEALNTYDQTLMLNPDNSQAQHNRAVVKKMLEEQEQQEQKQEQQDKQDSEQKDQQEQQNKQDQQQDKQQQKQDKDQQKQQSQQDQGQEGGQSSDQQQSKDAGEKQQKDAQDKKDRQKDGLDEQGDQEDTQEGGPDEQQEQPDEQEQRDTGGDVDRTAQEKKEEQESKQQQQHPSPSPELNEKQSQDMQAEGKEQEPLPEKEKKDAAAGLSPQLLQQLQRREERDAQLNKQVIRAHVGQQLRGKRGENLW